MYLILYVSLGKPQRSTLVATYLPTRPVHRAHVLDADHGPLDLANVYLLRHLVGSPTRMEGGGGGVGSFTKEQPKVKRGVRDNALMHRALVLSDMATELSAY